jgi:hypothetical protein
MKITLIVIVIIILLIIFRKHFWDIIELLIELLIS